jgi:prophage DNA circulation protein
VQLHEYPGRDVPLAEDLGARAHEHRLEAYVLGDDYMAARDALIQACTAAGPGLLVHPYLGTREVLCTGCRLSESSAEGRIARLSLTFVQAGEVSYPSSRPDTAARVGSTAELARQASTATFAENFTTRGVPQFVADAAAATASGLSAELAGMPGLAAVASAAVGDFASNIPDMVRNPGGLAAAVQSTVLTVLQSTAASAVSSVVDLDAGLDLVGFGNGLAPVPATTPSRLRQGANQAAFVDLVRRTGVIETMAAVPGAALETRDEAVSLGDRIASAVDSIADAASVAGDDNVFATVSDLHTAVVEDLTARAPDLSGVARVATLQTEPALVAAYRIYGDASRADELVRRNGVRHPGFVPGGGELRALTDG